MADVRATASGLELGRTGRSKRTANVVSPPSARRGIRGCRLPSSSWCRSSCARRAETAMARASATSLLHFDPVSAGCRATYVVSLRQPGSAPVGDPRYAGAGRGEVVVSDPASGLRGALPARALRAQRRVRAVHDRRLIVVTDVRLPSVPSGKKHGHTERVTCDDARSDPLRTAGERPPVGPRRCDGQPGRLRVTADAWHSCPAWEPTSSFRVRRSSRNRREALPDTTGAGPSTMP